ncbi:NAD(P)-binding protein [Naviculisporaceae sp. PSN 640]
MTEHATTIPKGSLVLVTGATGYVATHIIKEFLTRGYRVRGTVRDLEKSSWLLTSLFKSYADQDLLELVSVPTLADDHAFDEAVKGVSAIIHVASIVTFDSDPNKVIPQTVLGATSVLEAALKEPSVREFVFTSSIVAASFPVVGNDTVVGPDTFNEAAIKMSWAPGATPPGGVVYAASKAEAEKAVWRFSKERNPHFTINVIGPSMILGEPLHKSHLSSAGAWLKQLIDGDFSALEGSPAIYSVDVKDVALLHLAAALDPEVKGARLQAWADNTNWNKILAILRRLYPDKTFPQDISDLPDTKLTLTTDLSQSLALLEKWGGKEGWTPLEKTLADNASAIWNLQ